MEKTKVNTALAIFFTVTAVIVIGGLAATTLITTAMAAKPNFDYCIGGTSLCAPSQDLCERVRESFRLQPGCHPHPIIVG